MTITRIGHDVDGRRNTLLKWKVVNESKTPANMKISSKNDIHTKEVTCDVEKFDIFLGFKKENEEDYRCIQRKNHSTYAVQSHADVSLVMIGKGSFYLLHFNFFSCKNSSNYNKSMLVLLACNI